MRSQSGFSAVEFIVAAAVIGTVSTAALAQSQEAVGLAYDAVVQYDLRNAATAATIHATVEGQPPETWDDIIAAGHRPSEPFANVEPEWDPDIFCLSLAHPEQPDRPFRFSQDEGHVTEGTCQI